MTLADSDGRHDAGGTVERVARMDGCRENERMDSMDTCVGHVGGAQRVDEAAIRVCDKSFQAVGEIAKGAPRLGICVERSIADAAGFAPSGTCEAGEEALSGGIDPHGRFDFRDTGRSIEQERVNGRRIDGDGRWDEGCVEERGDVCVVEKLDRGKFACERVERGGILFGGGD